MTYEKIYNSDRLTILVAEDEEYNFLFVSEILKGYNINIIRAHNGKMALNQCTINPDIDLVLMDVSMPVMDGLEATKRIKSLIPNLPIIIQTSYSSLSDKSVAFAAGCDGFLQKPFLKADLLSSIEAYMPKYASLERV